MGVEVKGGEGVRYDFSFFMFFLSFGFCWRERGEKIWDLRGR